MAFAPDGTLLATADEDIHGARLWRVGDGLALVAELVAHTDVVTAMAFDPSGVLLATGSIDRTIKLWNVASRALVRSLEGHTDAVLSLAFSSRGTLASAANDNTIKLWEPRAGRLLSTLEAHRDGVRSVAFLSGGDLLASAAATDRRACGGLRGATWSRRSPVAAAGRRGPESQLIRLCHD